MQYALFKWETTKVRPNFFQAMYFKVFNTPPCQSRNERKKKYTAIYSNSKVHATTFNMHTIKKFLKVDQNLCAIFCTRTKTIDDRARPQPYSEYKNPPYE